MVRYIHWYFNTFNVLSLLAMWLGQSTLQAKPCWEHDCAASHRLHLQMQRSQFRLESVFNVFLPYSKAKRTITAMFSSALSLSTVWICKSRLPNHKLMQITNLRNNFWKRSIHQLSPPLLNPRYGDWVGPFGWGWLSCHHIFIYCIQWLYRI